MHKFIMLIWAIAIVSCISLAAGDNKEKKKKSEVNPKAATVTMDVELKGMVVKEEKEQKRNQGTKTIYYLSCADDGRKYELPVPAAKEDPGNPENFVGKNVVLKGTTEVSALAAKVTTVTSIKELK